MPRSRRFAFALVMTALAALTVAAPVGAQTPNGQLADIEDFSIVLQSCSDPSILSETVLVPRGGGAATWVTDGRMFVLKSIAATVIVTPDEGDPFTVSFEHTMGAKTGMETVVTCDYTQSFPGIETTGTITLSQVR